MQNRNVGDGGVLGVKREKGVCELGGRWERGKGEGEWRGKRMEKSPSGQDSTWKRYSKHEAEIVQKVWRIHRVERF